MKFNPL